MSGGYKSPRKVNRIYSIEEVADFLGVSVRTVRRLVAKGELECIQLNQRRRVFQWVHIHNYLQGKQTGVFVGQLRQPPVDEFGRWTR